MRILASLLACLPLLGLGLPLGAQVTLQGAGATFPYPLYSKWVAEYQKVDPQVRINYQSIGSGGGIRQILEGTVDFGATDAPMTAAERAKAKAPILHLPVTLGAVAVAYNVPGVGSGLKLDAASLSGIYLGQIRTWNDGRIAALNPGLKLPGSAILVAYRSDGSGTTAVFTEYLAKVSPPWRQKVGAGKNVKFPVGLAAKGNEGVTGLVKQTPGALGYLELAYARQNGLAVAALKNAAGRHVPPSPEGATAAASELPLPDDLCLSLTDAPGPKAYPISSFSYILVPQDLPDPAKGKALAGFLQWALAADRGQAFAGGLDYAPLPGPVAAKVSARLHTLTSGGRPLLPAPKAAVSGKKQPASGKRPAQRKH